MLYKLYLISKDESVPPYAFEMPVRDPGVWLFQRLWKYGLEYTTSITSG
jgi:hypothetical protein